MSSPNMTITTDFRGDSTSMMAALKQMEAQSAKSAKKIKKSMEEIDFNRGWSNAKVAKPGQPMFRLSLGKEARALGNDIHKMSLEYDKAAKKSKRYRDKGKRDLQDIRNQAKITGGVFKGSLAGNLLGNAISRGTYLVAAGVRNVAEEYTGLDRAANEAAVKFGNIDYGSAKFQELVSTAREVGRTTQFTARDAAEGLFTMAGAGFEVDNALRILPATANFAAAAKMSLADAVGVAGNALNQFGLNAKDAETQEKNLILISDKLAETDRMSMASMQGLAETAAYSANEFVNAGQSIDTWMTMAALLADVKKEGSVGGTVMRGMVADLSKVGPQAVKAFAKLGIKKKRDIFYDEKGNAKSYLQLLKEMEPAFKKLDDPQKTKYINEIFGRRSAGGVLAMLNNLGKADEYFDRVSNKYSGGSEKMGKQLTQSLGMRLELLKNAAQEKGFQVLDQLLTGGKGGIEGITKAINEMDVKPIAEFFSSMASGVKFIVDHSDELAAFGKLFLKIKLGMMGMNVARWGRDMVGALGGMVGMNRGMGQLAGSINSISGATTPGGASGTGQKIGASAGQTFVGIVQAAGIGYAIGSTIESYLTGKGERFQEDTVSAENRVVQIQRKLGTLGTSKEDRSEAQKLLEELTEIGKSRSEAVGEMGLIGGASAAITASDEWADLQRLQRMITDAQSQYAEKVKDAAFQAKLDATYQREFIKQFMETYRQSEGITKLGETKIVVELTGDGAKGAKVTKKESASNAPKVDVSQAGAN